MEYQITTERLSKQYKNFKAVDQVSLHIRKRSIYGFLGPNGAGKSTTLKMILGLAHPTGGEIDVFGKRMNAKNRLDILKDIGSLIESPSYYGHLTGEENLKILQTLRKVPEQNIREALEIVRLTSQKDKQVAHYSLGMKQRLGLAAALLAHPRLLILDEPTNGLDPAGIQEMRELICDLPRRFGMTVLVSSHLLSEIDQMATHVGVIADGALVYQNTIDRLHEKSEHHLALRTLNNPLAKAILTHDGVINDLDADEIILPPLENEEVAHCVALLTDSGIGVLRIEERRKNLEDIFLELTEGAASL